jgi:hypothetical protein
VSVALEDLGELDVVEAAALADEGADAVEQHEVEAAVLVVERGVAVGAVGVGEAFPGDDVGVEPLERQMAGTVEQNLGVIGELPAAARVGRGAPERVGLGDTDRTGVEVLDDRRHFGDQHGETPSGGDLLGGPAQLAAEEPADTRVTVRAESAVAVDRTYEDGHLGFDLPGGELELGEPAHPLGVRERIDVADQVVERCTPHSGMVIEHMYCISA